MNIPTFKFVFDRKHEVRLGKPGKVEMSLLWERRRKYFSMGVSVAASEWDPERGVCNREDAMVLNAHIEAQRRRVADAVNSIVLSGQEFSFSALDEVLVKKQFDGDFINYLKEKIEGRRDIQEITKKSHRKLLGALGRFGKIRRFSDLTSFRIRGFDNWLHENYTRQTTIYSFHKTFKVYVNLALGEGLLSRNPYLGLKFEKGKGSLRRFLTDEQLRAVRGVTVDDGPVMRAKDVFLFQCFTGLSHVDLGFVKRGNIIERDGKMILHGKRRKTGEDFYLVLLSPAVEILRRYDFKLPAISNQKYNQFLHILGAYAGLPFRLTSHCGRHTYATWALNKGVPLETLKVMMGHSDIKTTLIYAKMLNKTVETAFEMLESKL